MPTKTAKKRPQRSFVLSKSARKSKSKKPSASGKFSLSLRRKPAPKKHMSAKTRKKISDSLIKRYSRKRGIANRKFLLVTFLVLFAGIGGYFIYSSYASTTLVGTDGDFTPLTPARILDTRAGLGSTKAPIGANKTISVQITGQGGVPAANVKAVTLNMTVTAPTTGGWLAVWPSGTPRPNASSINFAVGQTLAKAVTVPVGADGKVQIYNPVGTVHVIFDLAGYYASAGASQHGARFNSVNPTRILDTRTGLGSPKAPIGGGKTLSVQVAGRGGVPGLNVKAVTLNLTVTTPTTVGWLAVWPSGTPRPNVSSINFTAGQTVANEITVPVGPDGKIQIYNPLGSTHVLLDVAGYFEEVLPGYEKVQEGRFVPLTPARILDTRSAGGAIGSAKTLTRRISEQGGLPYYDNIRAVVLNVAVTAPTTPGYLTISPTGTPRPTASSINFAKGQTIANQVTVPIGRDGQIDIYNALGSTHVILDVAGYYLDNPRYYNVHDSTYMLTYDSINGSKTEYTFTLQSPFDTEGAPRFQVYPYGTQSAITFGHNYSSTSGTDQLGIFIYCAPEGACQSTAPGATRNDWEGSPPSYSMPYGFTAPASYKVVHEVLVDQPGFAGPWEFVSITNPAGVKTDLLAQQRNASESYNFSPFYGGIWFSGSYFGKCSASKLASASISNVLLNGQPFTYSENPSSNNTGSPERAFCPGGSRIEYTFTGRSDTTVATLKGNIPKELRNVKPPVVGAITPNYTNKTVTVSASDESGLTDMKADVDGFSIYKDYSDPATSFNPPLGTSFTDTYSLQGIASGPHTLHVVVTDRDGVQSEKTMTITIP